MTAATRTTLVMVVVNKQARNTPGVSFEASAYRLPADVSDLRSCPTHLSLTGGVWTSLKVALPIPLLKVSIVEMLSRQVLEMLVVLLGGDVGSNCRRKMMDVRPDERMTQHTQHL